MTNTQTTATTTHGIFTLTEVPANGQYLPEGVTNVVGITGPRGSWALLQKTGDYYRFIGSSKFDRLTASESQSLAAEIVAAP